MRRAPIAIAVVLAFGCRAAGERAGGVDAGAAARSSASTPTGAPITDAAATDAAASSIDGSAPADRPLHFSTTDELLTLIPIAPGSKHGIADPEAFLRGVVGVGGPAHANQGNAELAVHTTSRAQCLEGLRGDPLQTDEQKERCGGHAYMVPIYRHGRAERARTCIDQFEFPNRPCELPIVWISPTQAARVCALEGKRLCTQEEWVLACSGDPDGGKPWRYAYGNDLDLEICNTNKSTKTSSCDAGSASSAWKTCATLTEPSGAYPRCRSRFGVFDMHGNVAEEMSRLDEDGEVYSQLKGSAFFYVDVARVPGVKATKDNYPDMCAHDPRWHVEPINDAWHVNYHLGFRCCLSIH